MRTIRFAALCTVIALSARSAQAQSATSLSASSVLAQLAAAFSGGKPTYSISLTGNAHVYEGASSDSGIATLTASADGSTSVQLQLSGGNRSEVVTASGNDRTCNWSGAAGVVHDEATGNCWTAVVWFLPQISLQPGVLSSVLGTDYLGLQSSAGAISHVLRNQIVAGPGKTPLAVTQQIAQRSTTTLRLDSSSMLPSMLDYSILSDSGTASIDVEVRYSNYQQLSGLRVPTHIERYLNGSLQLTLDITQAAVLK
jgi:hypothetical protein